MVQAGYMATGQMVRMPFQPMGFGAMAMPQRPGPVSMGTSSLTMTSPVSGGLGNLPNRKGDDKTQPRNPLDLLGQEVMQTQKQQQKQKQTVAPLQEKAAPEQQQAAVPTTDSLLSLGLEPSPATHPIASANLSSTSPASFTPLAPPPKPATPVSLENVFVPLDTIKPGEQRLIFCSFIYLFYETSEHFLEFGTLPDLSLLETNLKLTTSQVVGNITKQYQGLSLCLCHSRRQERKTTLKTS